MNLFIDQYVWPLAFTADGAHRSTTHLEREYFLGWCGAVLRFQHDVQCVVRSGFAMRDEFRRFARQLRIGSHFYFFVHAYVNVVGTAEMVLVDDVGAGVR